ncbi:MAG: chloride channel protein [Bacteroidetes bacterium]|nr:chloride channel protein [Bacteroidota bacterium]
MKFQASIDKIIQWRFKHISEKKFLILVSFVVGVFTALTACFLKKLIQLIQGLLTHNFSEYHANYLYLIYPVVGILLAGLFVKYIVKDDISHGVTKILYAISQRKSRIKPHNIYSSVAASSITIGFGGSVGAEAPIVLTGAAIGSNLGRILRLEQKHLMILLGCGAAGAIAGIFKAPIAGLVFVIEVLMLDLTMTSILPLLISSVTAATVSYLLTGNSAMFHFVQNEPFLLKRIPSVLLLGIFCGFVSLYFTRSMTMMENIFRKLQFWQKFVLGGLLLSALIFLLPPLYGEGYETIEVLLGGGTGYQKLFDGSLFNDWRYTQWGIIVLLTMIIVLKSFATSATNGGGGTGGTFAPSLYLGGIAGFLFAYIGNTFHWLPFMPQENFALMGMAGVMAGVMHAPLTGTFLIAELTGGYDLFLPLMIVSICSYLTITIFEKHSIYTMRLAKKGELLTHHKDQAVLTLLKVYSLIETDFQIVNPYMDLGDVVKVISQSSRNSFPVVSDDGKLEGIVLIDNIRNIMFRPELYKRFRVTRFMVSPPAVINVSMTMDKIMRVFDDTKAWNLPVVDENNKYLGFVSKSSMLNAYRQVLVDIVDQG